MDGLEFCRRVRELCPDTVVILMSGRSDEIDPATVQQAGAATILAKPFAMQTVVRLLGEVVDARDKNKNGA